MEHSSILIVVIEVAIAIAGFSSIVVVLGRSGSAVSAEARLYLNMLLTASLLGIGAAFLPLLLEAGGVAEPLLWTVPSSIWVVIFVVVSVIRIIGVRKSGASFSRRRIGGVLMGLSTSAALLCLVNAVVLATAWPYLTAMVLIVFFAGFSFVALLYELIF